jgi:hypothetical protein
MATMRIRALIKALGGPTFVADECGLGIAAVSNWSARDFIAREHQATVWRLAIAKNIAWTPPDFEGMALVPAPESTVEGAPKPRLKRRPLTEAAG